MDVKPNQKIPFSTSVSSSSVRTSEFNLAFTLATGFLTFNTVVAIVRIREDILAVTFTISFFVFLMIFFWCLSLFEKSPQDSKEKERLKLPIWFLATTLNMMFAYRVWTLIRPGMALGWLVWGMAGSASVITFYFFFVYAEKKRKTGDCNSKLLYAQQV
ncbi:hypothetical protein AAC387_Pa04g2249 [Persea americana]|eukprot:TRINITY_DN1386_c0_g1_i2.p1 TRINITY_DN1386_c0_g1~~TRINITY_DN1386_c0_g1_i2.p1  ORF type:complete len:159 (+),score=14.94 TRINITY_DN1386_c0_g1_i2:2478-2954(+)